MKVLITGAAGVIGTVLAKGLRERHELRGFDNQEMPGMSDAVVGDIGDFDQVKAATEGMDAVIHLVNVPGGQWEHSLQSMIGTYNVFEAAHQCGVRRVAYASRGGILPQSFYPRTIQRTADMLPKPDSYYTISKVFGENIGYMYPPVLTWSPCPSALATSRPIATSPSTRTSSATAIACVSSSRRSPIRVSSTRPSSASPTATGRSTTWTTGAR